MGLLRRWIGTDPDRLGCGRFWRRWRALGCRPGMNRRRFVLDQGASGLVLWGRRLSGLVLVKHILLRRCRFRRLLQGTALMDRGLGGRFGRSIGRSGRCNHVGPSRIGRRFGGDFGRLQIDGRRTAPTRAWTSRRIALSACHVCSLRPFAARLNNYAQEPTNVSNAASLGRSAMRISAALARRSGAATRSDRQKWTGANARSIKSRAHDK